MTRVSVITRTKDRPLMLPRARESVVSQTFKDFTWVLVNDAGARQYVEENAAAARDAGIHVEVVHREASVGMEAASNAGCKATNSEFIIIHDDDDTWEPEFLEHCVTYLDDNQDYSGVITISNAVYERLEKDEVVEITRTPYNPQLQSIQLADMFVENQFAPISFLFRRSTYEQIGGFDESLPVLGDWDFNLRFLLCGDIGVLPMMLANYHIRESVSKDQVVYGNSITAGVNIHVLQDAKYRNLKLRQDIKNGELGIGFLLIQGRQFHGAMAQLSLHLQLKALPKKFVKKIKRVFGKTSK